MTMKQLVGGGMLVSLGLAVIGACISDITTAENFYIVGGLGMFIFGIWGSVLLLKKEKEEDKK